MEAAFLFVLFVSGACAETLLGKVIKIADGDALTILDASKREHRIRLAGIDAPERKQAHYETSRQTSLFADLLLFWPTALF